MICMQLLEFQREFGCLCSLFDSLCVFEHEVGLGSLRVSVFFGNVCICERVCVCVCVCVCSTVLFGEGSRGIVTTFSMTTHAPQELASPVVLLQPHSIFFKTFCVF